MKDITDERSTLEKPLSFQKMRFRYYLAKRLLPKNQVLDIGCGNGYGADYFLLDYSGIDYYYKAIEEANKNYFLNDFNVMELPSGLSNYKDNSQENIICCELIEHLSYNDGQKLLNEIHRILNPEGYLFLTTPIYKNQKELYKNHIQEYSKSEMKEFLLRYDFKIIKEGGYYTTYLIDFLRFIRGKNKSENFSLRTKEKKTKWLLIKITKISNLLGYYFPSIAKHQWYLCQK